MRFDRGCGQPRAPLRPPLQEPAAAAMEQAEEDWRSAKPEGWFEQAQALNESLAQEVETSDIAATIEECQLPPSCDKAAVRSFFDSHPVQARSLSLAG